MSPSGKPTRLRVQGADGRVQTLELNESSAAHAIRKAAAGGLRVLSVEEASVVANSAPQGLLGRTSRSSPFPLLLFSQELLALLDAGLNLSEALSTLHAKERSSAPRRILAQALDALREGKNFSDVLAATPQHFPEVYVATVRASERTGDLPQALVRYIAYQLQFDTIRKKMVSAAIYPAMLLAVGGFVTLFLLGYVVPRFATVYESSGREMPWISTVLLSMGKAIYSHGPLAGLVVLGSLATLAWGLNRPAGRAWLLGQVLRLPWLATKADEFRLARFYRAVSLLLTAGIALPRAMGMVTGLLGKDQQAGLAKCRASVEQGHPLSQALVAAGLSHPVTESLVRVGERSGQMAEMLERAARFADDDLSRHIDWASRLLEPILMTIIGLVIGAVVVLMYMPVFELAGSLQ